jgi:hypothetical protein
VDVGTGAERAEGRPREWTGTLVAEWSDRGLGQQAEDFLAILPWAFVWLLGGSTLLVVASGRPQGWLFVPMFGVLWLAYAAWYRLRHPDRAALRLQLDTEMLRLTRTTGSDLECRDLPRVAAGRLRAMLDSRGNLDQLQLHDAGGSTILTFGERLVAVTALPFGMTDASIGGDRRNVSLAVLIGSWWPDPSAREDVPYRGRFSLRSREPLPWKRPDLDGYGAWKTTMTARAGLLMVGSGAFLVAIGVLSGTPYVVNSSVLYVAAFVSVGGACIAYGLREIWPARHDLRAVLRLRPRRPS